MINKQPDTYIKPTIEKKVIKLEDGTDFVLDYPSNYNEIVNKKLAKLEREYEETIRANIPSSSITNHPEQCELKDNHLKQTGKEDKGDFYINQEIAQVNDDKEMKEENMNEENEENEGNDNNAGSYQQIGEEYNQLNEEEEEEFIVVKEDDNIVNSEPINIVREDNVDNCKERPVENINEEKTNSINNDKHEDKDIQSNEMNDIEFIKEPIKKEVKRKCSPIKNPEKIKEVMRSIHIKPPKWAENLSDEEFLKRAKQFFSNNQFK